MTFRAPVRDLAFAMKTAGFDAVLEKGYVDTDFETVEAVLEAAGSLANEVLAPLNRIGDTVGAQYANGRVTAAPGFADAYKQFIQGGWTGLVAEPEFGGQGLPKAVEVAVFEMMQSANMAFSLCPMLSLAAIEALTRHGTERQKKYVLPKLVSGEWTGAMVLTEPQAGTDLAALTTTAKPDGEGGYTLHGQKIFITWGDHDMADNIVHLVIARTPDAPPGVKGISLFLTSRRLMDENGVLGARNDFRPASIEHKMGIHGSPTCVMLYEGAKAELVGELNNGLSHMFVMMNAARLEVGVQGVAIAERAFQQALAFSQERIQGQALWATGASGPIYDHPDVRRTLTLSKARIEAARGLCLMTGVLADLARVAPTPEERAGALARQELLTPIAKAWSTDMGVEVASASLQVHGGMGYIEETGAAQHYRDARIPPIYEGTNGIQAIDLSGRKLKMTDGAAMRELCAEMVVTAEALTETADLAGVGRRLALGVQALEKATEWQLANQGAASLLGATTYLKLAGDVIGGWFLARQALNAAGADAPWLKAKASLARIFASQVLSLAPGLAEAVMEPLPEMAALAPEALAG
ncbi:MAG TPA: acyl-CoA dehydrogenase [Phenylobacterium sp.]|uniref:acyl-CoA dehydrogenase n=1 Tax=Phenylobacterium sp. TaxID=1871053 RepID=UPI002B49BBCF|nr:acyl-CoA dehydrogenase [Phenylobacterium sp.]HKR87760.1 acyl-CoA dehydrogenase [Phenylobacterium sp.]